MERESDDRVETLVGHDIHRHALRHVHSDPGLVSGGYQQRDDRKPARQESLDQPLALDDELAQPARQVRGLERTIDGDTRVIEVIDRYPGHRGGSSGRHRNSFPILRDFSLEFAEIRYNRGDLEPMAQAEDRGSS